MTFFFNLIEKPFIPCVRLDGRSVEFGLRDVLAKAHESLNCVTARRW